MSVAVPKHPLFGLLLNIVPRTWIIAQVYHPGEPVQAIPDGDVKGFAENTVSLLRVSDDLSITSRNIKYDWVLSASYLSAHLNV